MHPPSFRLLDQVSLALERGNEAALLTAREHRFEGIGPLLEAQVLSHDHPGLTSLVFQLESREVVQALSRAKEAPLRVVSGSDGAACWGMLCFREASEPEWSDPLHLLQLETQKALRFRRKISGAKARICGAIEEMVDNIFDHSGAPHTGAVGFVGTPEHVDIVVADAGMGILASLQSNPKFAYLRDSGTAMQMALQDGNSRYGPGLDRGYGFGTLFRALNSLDAGLRFRSGDYALEIAGRSPSLRSPHISQKAELRGFVVSIRVGL